MAGSAPGGSGGGAGSGNGFCELRKPLLLPHRLRSPAWGPLLLPREERSPAWGPLLLPRGERSPAWGPLLLPHGELLREAGGSPPCGGNLCEAPKDPRGSGGNPHQAAEASLPCGESPAG